MISKEEWISIITAYSKTIWPVQIFFYVIAILITGWFLLKPGRIPNKIIKLYFVVVFAWNGIMWFFVLAKDMGGDGYANYIFGVIYIVVSVLFWVDIFRINMQFAIPTSRWQKFASLTLLTLVFCYPLFGMASGHDLDRLIFPGTYPCPTAALGIVLLTMTITQVDKIIYMLLLILAIPFTPFIQILKYNVYEDIILFTCGIYGLILYLKVNVLTPPKP